MCHYSLVIFVTFSNGSRHMVAGNRFSLFFKIEVYEIVIDLPETSSRYTRHGDETSGSTVLFMSFFVGVDSHFATKM